MFGVVSWIMNTGATGDWHAFKKAVKAYNHKLRNDGLEIEGPRRKRTKREEAIPPRRRNLLRNRNTPAPAVPEPVRVEEPERPPRRTQADEDEELKKALAESLKEYGDKSTSSDNNALHENFGDWDNFGMTDEDAELQRVLQMSMMEK
eukprot:TRINITY_DN22730_c0_g1_i1.p1 TRINITY_DN22730_c0_g1~~TRINITY_DN22730_c0_g1_i1.p1  ORF type:complete len:162 (-),score=51.75 TRINITY_DN22730_c0_g1_i1:58-501(-)